MPHRLLVTVIAVAVTALGTLVSSARAHEPVSMDIRPLAFEVIDGPDDDQRVRLDATLYVPSSATPATPAPVVVLAHGFGGDKGDLDALARQTAHHGYLALAYSARGFGRSTGAIGLDSLDYDVKDVRQIVDALAEVPEVALDAPGDPRIGLSGRSYGGGIALMAATQDRRIDAIAPRITWSSLAYSLAPNNLTAPEGNDLAVDLAPGGVLKAQWSSIFFGLGAVQPLAGGVAPGGLGSLVDRRSCLGFVPEVCRAYLASVAAGEPTPATIALLERSSPSEFLDTLLAPTFLVQGQDDTLFNLAESARTYAAVRDNGAPAKLLWHDGGHSGDAAPGEEDEGLDPDDVVNARILTWWDRWLAGDATVDTGPGFETFLGGDGERTVYATSPAFPPSPDTTWYLSGDGGVVDSPGEVVAGSATFRNPPLGVPAAYSETSGIQRQLPVPPLDLPGQHVAWETPTFTADLPLVGVPRLVDVKLSSASGEAWFYAKLYDVGPGGDAVLIRRQVSPVRADDLSAPLGVVLPGVSHVMEAGHHLRLVLAATDAAHANRRLPDTTTVTVDPDRPPRLLLPLGELPGSYVAG